MGERETEGQQLVHSSVINIDGGQGKHPMQLTIHSCGHAESLFCAGAEVYTAATSYSGVTNANT